MPNNAQFQSVDSRGPGSHSVSVCRFPTVHMCLPMHMQGIVGVMGMSSLCCNLLAHGQLSQEARLDELWCFGRILCSMILSP